jgi:FlaA1/EpsC-like NDP-sugar epimerase
MVKKQTGASEKSTLIYGAGEAGLMLLREIRRSSNLPYRVRGFVDDQPGKKGLRMGGVAVLGGGEQIGPLVSRYRIEMVLIAIPSATGAEMTRILELCHGAGVECKTVPGLAEMIAGQALAGQIREVAVEDLLGRSPVELSEDQIRESIAGKIILVTGAGGSIGSELCRQIARFGPAGIVGFDSAESALFEIDREIQQLFPQVPFYPEIGNIQNVTRLDEVFGLHRPASVYHAAAYKHVPLMETHIFEAVENNIFGTYNVATAAIRADVESFVLISSDKAVCPTNVMGATKRVAELLLLGLQSDVKFVAVRFGNVLGSNGSVIPIFKKQIASGGPVTVTHPEMRRFFMTIPEACQLVLQAAAIADGGQICILDMGEPVKIVDLAKKLVLLSGLTPGKDIAIEFTGMRPGEKLNEELTSSLECTWPSSHEKIRLYGPLSQGEEDTTARWLLSLKDICRLRDSGRLLLALRAMVVDYNPSSELLERATHSQRGPVAEMPQPKIASGVVH